jgi:hypothetical protein
MYPLFSQNFCEKTKARPCGTAGDSWLKSWLERHGMLAMASLELENIHDIE